MQTSQSRNASRNLVLFSGLEKMPNPCFFAPLWLHHIPRHQKPQECWPFWSWSGYHCNKVCTASIPWIEPPKVDSCLTFHHSKIQSISRNFQLRGFSTLLCKILQAPIPHHFTSKSHSKVSSRSSLDRAVRCMSWFRWCSPHTGHLCQSPRNCKPQTAAGQSLCSMFWRNHHCFFRSKPNIWHADKRLSSSPTTKAENFRFKKDHKCRHVQRHPATCSAFPANHPTCLR